MQLSLYIDDDLAKKIDERLPRSVKIAPLGRWLLRGIVLTQKELEAVCRSNEDEARIIAPYLPEWLRKIYEAGKEMEKRNEEDH